ncbi:MAG TPA: DUF6763 family protein [Solimonas sp.]|nr:DUF6763 family protein [Solimonas sp.]
MAEWLREVSVGQWYQAGADPFEIVGFDAKAEIVLVQYFDGTLEEVDFEAWTELNAQPCAPPEDYSGAMDMERDDLGLNNDESLGARGGGRWDSPLDLLDLQDR